MMRRKESVAIITPGEFPVPSGKSGSVEQVVEKLSERLTRKMKVYVFARSTTFQPLKQNCRGVLYLRARYKNPAVYLSQISRRLKLLKPNIIQVENRPRYVRYLRNRHPKACIGLILHSISFISKCFIQKTELISCLRCANFIVVNSEFLRRHLLHRFPQFHNKVFVQHLGVDVNHFVSRWSIEGREQRLKLLHELGISDRKIILFVGRLMPNKGVHHLLKAMQKVREQHPEALLIVVGSAFYGSHRSTPYVRKLHQEGRKLPGHVRFIPYVSHENIPRWFQIADVAVFPSSSYEAFGLVNVEAMATGIPVITTRNGGIQEIIEHEQTGYMVNPDRIKEELPKYLHRILENKQLQRDMGERGMKRVHELFTWEKAAERRFALFENLLAKK